MALTFHILKFVNYLIAHLPFGSRNSPFIFQVDAIFCFAIGAFNSALYRYAGNAGSRLFIPDDKK